MSKRKDIRECPDCHRKVSYAVHQWLTKELPKDCPYCNPPKKEKKVPKYRRFPIEQKIPFTRDWAETEKGV